MVYIVNNIGLQQIPKELEKFQHKHALGGGTTATVNIHYTTLVMDINNQPILYHQSQLSKWKYVLSILMDYKTSSTIIII